MFTQINFPKNDNLPEDDIVYIGGSLNVENLKSAYNRGIFPWPVEGYPNLWHCPDPRGILEFEELHIPNSLLRVWNNHPYTFTIDKAFDEVINACSLQKRSGQPGTWINSELCHAYKLFHIHGYAHSVEVWENELLIGGLYGVEVYGVFSGESMFNKKSNIAKLALLYLIDHLKSFGATWMDIQMVTPLFDTFGGREISRENYLKKFNKKIIKKINIF